MSLNWNALWLLGGVLLSAQVTRAESPQPMTAMVKDMQFLSSEELRGRSVADDTIDIAADYIADQMRAAGLDMTAIGGKPFQPVSIELEATAGSADANSLAIRVPGQEPFTAKLGDDMNPMAVGATEATITAPLAFVGYGITAPKFGYDDYAGIDVTGHVAIILRKEPQAADPDSVFNGARNSRHAFFATKIQNAIENNAVAIIFVNDVGSVNVAIEEQRNRIVAEVKRAETIKQQIARLPAEAINNRASGQEKIEAIDKLIESMTAKLDSIRKGVMSVNEAGSRDPAATTEVPVVSMSRTMLDRLLTQAGGMSLAETETQIDKSLTPQSRLLPGVQIDFRSQVTPANRNSNNVIGVLPGKGALASESVIIGAHYDHVGMGGVGSLAPGTIAVHNGADDNASGTSVMLASARQMVRRMESVASHRRIVFVAFTGEERGLLGSKYYVRHPRFSLERTAAMINLDMVGRLRDNELTVYGTGSADELDEIVETANVPLGFKLDKVASGYGPSDHQSFYTAGVPVLFFFTGLHNDYHRPTDDFDKIDMKGMIRITDIVCGSTFQLAVRPVRPRYAETENNVKIRWQKSAFLGVMLSERDDQVVVSAVTPGEAAATGGIQAGDRLLQMGNTKLTTRADLFSVLRASRPGEQLNVTLVRGQQTLTIPVTLGSRQR